MAKKRTIQSSKIMAADIRKAAAAVSCVHSVDYVEMAENVYECYVGNIWENESDYLYNRNVFRAIRVTYAPECYALPRYITTKELTSIFKKSGARTLDDFLAAVLDTLEI